MNSNTDNLTFKYFYDIAKRLDYQEAQAIDIALNLSQHIATREEIKSTRTELKEEIQNVRSELKEVRTELKKDIQKLETKFDKLETRFENKFMWVIGIQVATLLAIIGSSIFS